MSLSSHARLACGEAGDESFLLFGLNGLLAIVRAHPGDGLRRRSPREGRETAKCGAGPTVTTEAAKFHSITPTGAFEDVDQDGAERLDIARHREVRPVEVLVRPRRLPGFVQVQPEVRTGLATVGIAGKERHGGDIRTVGEGDDPIMNVTLWSRTSSRFPVPSHLPKLSDGGADPAAAHPGGDCATDRVVSRYCPAEGGAVVRGELLAGHFDIVVLQVPHGYSLTRKLTIPPLRGSALGLRKAAWRREPRKPAACGPGCGRRWHGLPR